MGGHICRANFFIREARAILDPHRTRKVEKKLCSGREWVNLENTGKVGILEEDLAIRHIYRGLVCILLIDTWWTLTEVAGCAQSVPDQGRRLVQGALAA